MTIKMTLAYVGTRYAGWQIQPQRPTIQGLLEDRLGRLLRDEVTLFGAGRTDSGVHALGQVASFATTREVPLDGLRRGLNARLPEDIRVLEATRVADSFHARSDARGKEYAYRFSQGEVTSPFRAPFVCPVRGRLDLDAMRRGAAGFEGRHDFTSLAPASIELEDRV
ncbi:MAG TPA: tRNA pseudouridine(38-40) synthase TruA, partial [Candidatus Polarisedimenticolia bacterium]|nr:tRNA pseudouridine(38-40) synthase TruA [Candidatus Polarisedimenticolia bacterium]